MIADHECVWHAGDWRWPNARYKAFRWYYPVRGLATTNGRYFCRWMDLVKESDKRAIGFFAQLFVDFCLDDMDRKDLLIAVPPGDSTVDSARSPMARVVREVVKLGFGVDGSECVVRTHWVRQKKWPRNREEQRETIRLEGPPPDKVYRVVVVDDILTTVSKM